MEQEYLKYDPGTRTHKTPMPTDFGHLLKFITKVENFLGLHSQADITDINNQLDQTLNLMISNIIQRVIAQVVGETTTGFVTIKGSDDGALHVSVQDDPASLKTVKRAAISENTIANNQIIAAVTGKQLCIVNLMFTVAGEANIYLNSNANHMSGALDFGAASEPRGFVSNHGDYPLKTLSGEGFFIESDTTEQISGYVTYYEE